MLQSLGCTQGQFLFSVRPFPGVFLHSRCHGLASPFLANTMTTRGDSHAGEASACVRREKEERETDQLIQMWLSDERVTGPLVLHRTETRVSEEKGKTAQ